jgi:hypothetical protein
VMSDPARLPSTALFGVLIRAPAESASSVEPNEVVIAKRDESVAVAIHQQAWPILTGATADAAAADAPHHHPWSTVLSRQLLGKQVYRPARSKARWLHLTRMALTPQSLAALQDAQQSIAARKSIKTSSTGSPSAGSAASAAAGQPPSPSQTSATSSKQKKQKKRKSQEIEPSAADSESASQRCPVEWALMGSFGERKETELARLRPERGEVAIPLNVFVPIRTSSVSAPLRLWVKRYPQALIRLGNRSDSSPLDRVDLSVEVSGELVSFAPGEQSMVQSRAARQLAQVELEERENVLRDQLSLWQADDSDMEDRASRRDMEFWLAVDGPSKQPQALLALLLEYTKDYTLMLDPDWLTTGRAPKDSPAGILLRYLFQPYSDVSRRVLLRHGLCCKFKLSFDTSSSTTRTQYYFVALASQTDSRMATGMPEGIVELAQKALAC